MSKGIIFKEVKKGKQLVDEMTKNLKVLEDNQILIQKNQVEFEKYLIEINKKLDRLCRTQN